MAYYASTSTAQYYYPEDDRKGFNEEEEEEVRGRQPFSYISHGSSVSENYTGAALGYYTPEEDEESCESEELICKLPFFAFFHLLVRRPLELRVRFLLLISRSFLLFYIVDMDAEDGSTYNSPQTEPPPTPTYPITPTTSSSSSSYFAPRTDLQAPPPSDEISFQGGFNRGSATSQESLADRLLGEVREEFRTTGENGANLWVTGEWNLPTALSLSFFSSSERNFPS